jgi:hypothetical protein
MDTPEQLTDNDGQDQQRRCCDCGRAFTWNVGEQAFYAQRKLFPPLRCRPCRQARKAAGATFQSRQG